MILVNSYFIITCKSYDQTINYSIRCDWLLIIDWVLLVPNVKLRRSRISVTFSLKANSLFLIQVESVVCQENKDAILINLILKNVYLLFSFFRNRYSSVNLPQESTVETKTILRHLEYHMLVSNEPMRSFRFWSCNSYLKLRRICQSIMSSKPKLCSQSCL